MNLIAKIQWKNYLRPMLGFIVVFTLIFVWAPDSFNTIYNYKTILTQSVLISLGALGMTLLIMSGGLDLSTGAQVALITVVVAKVLSSFSTETVGWGPVALAVLAALFTGILASAWIGFLVSRFKVTPFLVSLGMMLVYRGLAKSIAHEATVAAPTSVLNQAMLVDPEPSFLFFAPGVWVLLIISIALYLILKKTSWGRTVLAMGSNETALWLCGLPVKKLKVSFYAVSGLMMGICGALQFSNLTVGDPTAGYGMELDMIAAAVLGGASLNGGQGSLPGTLIGSLVMALLRNGCNMIGLATYLQEILVGVVIVGVVIIDRFQQKSS